MMDTPRWSRADGFKIVCLLDLFNDSHREITHSTYHYLIVLFVGRSSRTKNVIAIVLHGVAGTAVGSRIKGHSKRGGSS
jgi:hypothetical protein